MKPLLRLLGLGLVLLLAQAAASRGLPEGFRPDPLLVFALAMGLRGSSTSSLLLAFGFGLTVDVLSGAPVGLFAMLRATACVVTRAFDGALYLRAALPWAIYVAAYAVFDGLLMGLCLYWFTPAAALSAGALLLRAPGNAIATALVAAPVLAVFRLLDADSVRESGWSLIEPGTRARP